MGGHAAAGAGFAPIAMLGSAMTHDTDDQDPKENELVIALTPVQLGFVVAIAVAAVIWFVVRRKRSA